MFTLSVTAWILSGLLALLMLLAGTMKLLTPHRGKKPMPTLDDYSDAGVRAIGAAELAGALGLILPGLLGILPAIAVLAALGLMIIQLLAVRAHRMHGEPFVANVVFALLALVIAVLRAVGA